MADYEDTKVKDLVINNMSQEKFDELKAAGELQPDQIYFTPDSGGASLPDQTDNAGKFLTTDGTTPSWGNALVNNTDYDTSVGIGSKATSYNAVAIGTGIQRITNNSVTIGYKADTNTTTSVAIGVYTYAANHSLALGSRMSASAEHSIQIGSSSTNVINTDPNTFKVYNGVDNYEIMSADGTIPADRMSAVAGTTGQVLTKTDTGMEWQDATGGELPDNVLVNNATGAQTISIGGTGTGSYSLCVGNASAAKGFGSTALGFGCVANAKYAIQLGNSGQAVTNSDANTFKVANGNGNFELMDANGNVPRERLKNLVEVLPTADNGYTTVKNYGNGYVEITGYTAIGTVGASTGSEVQIDLPAGYTMADTNYWVNIAPTSETTMFDFKAEAKARSTTHFMVAYKNEDTVTGLTAAGVYWEVRGMLATA